MSLLLIRNRVGHLLYLSAESSTLRGGARPPRDRAVASTDDVARGLQSVLRPSRAGARVAALRPGVAQRQRAQIDGSDAGARDRPGIVPSLPALHHRCAVERRRRVAATARGRAGTRRPADFRRDELSQTGPALGRRGAPVLWRAGQDRQLPGGRHRGVVDGGPRLSARGRAVFADGLGDRRRPRVGRGFPPRYGFKKNGARR